MTPFIDRLLLLPRYAMDGIGAIKPGFERIKALLKGMGHPERHFQVALVAGTNGKGSTSSMMAACLTSAGITTGLHTSPHLRHVSERMKVDGQAPSEEWLEQRAEQYFDLFQTEGASFFEATLALSLLWFADQGVTHAVVEVGLGGRLDATNILPAEVSVITSISMDHTDFLGDTIAKIATEKAGIIKPGRPVVLGNMPSEALEAISNKANSLYAPVLIASQQVLISELENERIRVATQRFNLDSVALGMLGWHQRGNAATAVCALGAWLPELPSSPIKEGLEQVLLLTGLRGRSEVVRKDPLLMVDVAHNPEAITSALITFKKAVAENVFPVVVIGLLADKDAAAIGQVLTESGMEVWTVPTAGARGLEAKNLALILQAAGANVTQAFQNTSEAIQFAVRSGKSCLVCGSHLVVTDALEHFGP
ncbi:MAG: Mur ligase family protein [Bacteroidetes bacterium]|nr:Mur ligase family protein [Bacteroidota bacterium]